MYPKEHMKYHPFDKINVVKVTFDFDRDTAQKVQYDLLTKDEILRASLNGFKGEGIVFATKDIKKDLEKMGLKVVDEEERDYWELLNNTYLL